MIKACLEYGYYAMLLWEYDQKWLSSVKGGSTHSFKTWLYYEMFCFAMIKMGIIRHFEKRIAIYWSALPYMNLQPSDCDGRYSK